MHQQLTNIVKQRVIAHRGASKDAPENTMAAFEKAKEQGIQWVEFDVMLSADHVALVFHDDELDRVSIGKGFINTKTAAELAELDVGSWFAAHHHAERIPTLTSLIHYLYQQGMCANVEIKTLHDNDEVIVEKTLAAIHGVVDPTHPMFLFSSFSVPVLKILRQVEPNVRIGLLMHEWYGDWLEIATNLNCYSIHVNCDILTAANVAEVKAAGYILYAYTVDDIKRVEQLFSWGVDAIFTNDPKLIVDSLI